MLFFKEIFVWRHYIFRVFCGAIFRNMASVLLVKEASRANLIVRK